MGVLTTPLHPSAVIIELYSVMYERTVVFLPYTQYDAGAYIVSVASSLIHNMTLELICSIKPGSQYDAGAYVVAV